MKYSYVDAMDYLNKPQKYAYMDDCEMCDLNAASVVEKPGNGDTPANEILAEVQDSLRDRFDLDAVDDSDDY